MTPARTPLVECVPNVSEGRDPQVIAALCGAILSVPGVRLLHVDAGADAHRTVFTFAGPPEPAGDAALALAREVVHLIDMREHRGAHPRLGALDVCPFVPVRHVSLARCAALARRVASTIAHDHRMPVYLYEAAAFDPGRRSLPLLRAGEFEGLARKLQDPAFTPDFGPATAHATLGASVVGARSFLVAWNVSLDTTDVSVAREIARRVRTSGSLRMEGRATHVSTRKRLDAVRALGWGMPSYGHAQVSLNLLDVQRTPLHVAFHAIAEEAAALGTRVIGSELIGLVPLDALREAGRAWCGHHDELSDDDLVQAAVDALGLAVIRPFRPHERVLEWVLDRSG